MLNTVTQAILILITVILLSACHHKKAIEKPFDGQSLSSWSLNGKIAIKSGKQNGSGRILWREEQGTTYAQFKAPLGQGSWEITENDHQATLRSSKHGIKTGSDAQVLISQELGWQFPWKKLSLWLRGAKDSKQLGHQNTIKSQISDQGWSIKFDKWQKTSLGLMPKKITATKPPHTVKLIIYGWEAN